MPEPKFALLDELRRVLRTWYTKDPDPEIKAYIDKFEVALTLRNKMDHLSGNLSNLANSKKATSPLFGSVSFFRPFSDRWHEGHERGRIDGEIIMIAAGSVTARTHVTVLFREISYRLPVGGLKLEAFGLTFMIEEAVEALLAILQRQSRIMLEYIEFVVADLVKNAGVTLEEATRQGRGTPTVYANAPKALTEQTPLIDDAARIRSLARLGLYERTA